MAAGLTIHAHAEEVAPSGMVTVMSWRRYSWPSKASSRARAAGETLVRRRPEARESWGAGMRPG